MNKLIKYFNENYGKEYGKISYPRTTMQIYRVYQAIKSYGINDDKLVELLHNVKLPNPKSVEEKELYVDCLYNKDDNEFDRDIFDTKEKKCLYKNIFSVKDGTYQKSHASYIFEDIDTPFELNQNNSYYIILNGEILSNIIDLSSYALTILGNESFGAEVSLDGATAELMVSLPSEVDIINFSLWENDECIFETQLLSQDAEEEEIVKDNYTFEINEDFNFDNYSSYYFVINNEIYKNKYRIINNGIELHSEDLDLYIRNDSIYIEKNNIKDCINIELWEDGEKNIKNSYLDKDVVIRKSLSIGENTSATNDYSFAQGYNVSASGKYSHAEGRNTTALGETSHSEGYYTKAFSNYQHVQGKHNIPDTVNKYAHIIGNGTSDTKRSNAHTLDWNGNGWYAGKLSQDGAPTNDKDLITKKYLDDILNGLPKLTFVEGGILRVTIGDITQDFAPLPSDPQ